MKIKTLLFSVLLVFMASCSSDSDYPLFNEDYSWESSLNEIVIDNKELFESRDMRIIGTKKLDDLKVDEDLFFSGRYGFFPIYSEEDSVYTIVGYEELERNADKYNFDKNKVYGKFNDYLENANDYDVIELTWICNSDTINSLALFNKRTSELEYDNMLFNMTSVSRYNANNFSLLLTQFETECVLDTVDVVEYWSGSDLVARAGVAWSVYGKWDHPNTIYLEDDIFYYIIEEKDFLLTSVSISPISYTSPYGGGETFVRYENHSVSLQPYYVVYYAIWAGPSGGFNSYDFSFSEIPSIFYGRFLYGDGKYRKLDEYISPRYTVHKIPKFN